MLYRETIAVCSEIHTKHIKTLRMISRSRRDVNKISALLGCYAAYIGSQLTKFRDNLVVSSSGVNQPKKEYIYYLSLANQPQGKRDIGRPKTRYRDQQHLQDWVWHKTGPRVLYLLKFIMMMMMMMMMMMTTLIMMIMTITIYYSFSWKLTRKCS
jgi:hypothetical protein